MELHKRASKAAGVSLAINVDLRGQSMGFDGDGVYNDKPDWQTEDLNNSLDIMPEGRRGPEQSDWLSSALDSVDDPTDVVTVSYSGGRMRARRYKTSPTDLQSQDGALPEGPSLDVDLAEETALVSLGAALRLASTQPGVDLVVVSDKNGTLLAGQENEEAALLAAYLPLFHDSIESLTEIYEHFTEELPQYKDRRLKMRFCAQKKGGGWYVCALGLPSCDLDAIIDSIIEHMEWLFK